ncbi:MAG: hypothetical protein IPO28_05480 [Holophagaceae bacterium]|nr:hypothetical protein [Holophagaceae bacterium]
MGSYRPGSSAPAPCRLGGGGHCRPAALLSDHAHCEGGRPERPQPQPVLRGPAASAVLLARLAEEELNHYRRVLEALQGFGWVLRPDLGNPYAQALHKLA